MWQWIHTDGCGSIGFEWQQLIVDNEWKYHSVDNKWQKKLAWSFWSTPLRFTESAELREVAEESELVLPVEAAEQNNR